MSKKIKEAIEDTKIQITDIADDIERTSRSIENKVSSVDDDTDSNNLFEIINIIESCLYVLQDQLDELKKRRGDLEQLEIKLGDEENE